MAWSYWAKKVYLMKRNKKMMDKERNLLKEQDPYGYWFAVGLTTLILIICYLAVSVGFTAFYNIVADLTPLPTINFYQGMILLAAILLIPFVLEDLRKIGGKGYERSG